MRSRKKNNKKNTRNKRYTFARLNCAPAQKNMFSCYDNDTLHSLRDVWNIKNKNDKIQTNDPKEIWKLLKKKMKNCSNEACWMKKILKLDPNKSMEIFAPEAPKSWNYDPDKWLTSDDITNVMTQYEKKYPKFEFLGPSPIDFSSQNENGTCVWEELCNFNLKRYIDLGTTKIGIILNTDDHTESGSHWVSLFININPKNNYIFFFDSTGDVPQKEVKEFIKNVIQQGDFLGIKFKYFENKQAHQKQNTECGMYSLYMIVNLIKETKSPKDFMKGERIPDEDMLDFRKEYFNRGGSV